MDIRWFCFFFILSNVWVYSIFVDFVVEMPFTWNNTRIVISHPIMRVVDLKWTNWLRFNLSRWVEHIDDWLADFQTQFVYSLQTQTQTQKPKQFNSNVCLFFSEQAGVWQLAFFHTDGRRWQCRVFIVIVWRVCVFMWHRSRRASFTWFKHFDWLIFYFFFGSFWMRIWMSRSCGSRADV